MHRRQLSEEETEKHDHHERPRIGTFPPGRLLLVPFDALWGIDLSMAITIVKRMAFVCFHHYYFYY